MRDWRSRCGRVVTIVFCIVFGLSARGCGAPGLVSTDELLQQNYVVSDPEFIRLSGNLFGPPYAKGNSITTFVDAGEIFPAMLEAIESAKHSITLETFIFSKGEIGDRFAMALAERARAGVKVHVIVDAVGSSDLHKTQANEMETAGVELVRYNPPEKILLVFNAAKVNHRTHRKLLVVDGRIGFIGGVGISDDWFGTEESPTPWRETGYRVEGPVVAQMQATFLENWLETRGAMLNGKEYFPPLEPQGELPAQIVRGSPDHGRANMELLYLMAINGAEQSIDIGTPYFVPNDDFVAALEAAAQRSVRVRLVIAGPDTDSELARQASKAKWDRLLNAGVQLHEYQGAMYHPKLLVIDGVWTSVGSANLDPRSLRLSDEANLNVYSKEFAASQIDMLERDIARSNRITKWEHENRSLFDRVGEFFSSLFAPQL